MRKFRGSIRTNVKGEDSRVEIDDLQCRMVVSNVKGGRGKRFLMNERLGCRLTRQDDPLEHLVSSKCVRNEWHTGVQWPKEQD